jgi:KDO2-lipid IV(A) lauroyltransferase
MNQSRPLTRSEWHLFRILMGVFYVIGRIPRVVSRKIGNLLGDAGYWLDRRHREIALDNISLALGNELDRAEQASLARAVYRNLGQIIFEVGWSVTAELESLYDHVTIEGLENYLAAFKKGKGVLVITAHIGNWELASVVAKKAGMPIHVVYRPLDFRPLDLFFKATRSRFGATLIPSRHALYDGVWVDFFGRRTCTSKGMALIALKTGAPVLPVFLYREASGFRAVFGKEIPLVVTGDKTSDIESNTLNYSKAIEKGIRKHPEQWFWVHRRWKKRPYCLWPRTQS